VLSPHQAKLVLNQWVLDNVQTHENLAWIMIEQKVSYYPA
jgi:hypothetical protein